MASLCLLCRCFRLTRPAHETTRRRFAAQSPQIAGEAGVSNVADDDTYEEGTMRRKLLALLLALMLAFGGLTACGEGGGGENSPSEGQSEGQGNDGGEDGEGEGDD